MSADDLQPGQRGRITQVLAHGPVRQRLMDLGLLPDVEIRLERVAPTGDPLWIRLAGAEYALRCAEARALVVVPA